MIKVSLIIPVYNTGKYLKRCLDSVINQTLKDIEIIIINDGSTDNSDNIIKSYKDKRINYIKQTNKGIGKTRNKGIDISKGEYIAFVDSDDYLDLNFCKHLYNKCHNDKCDIVVCDYYEERDNLKQEIKFKSFLDTNLKENPSLINNINLGPCNKLYRRSLFANKSNRFEEDLKYEDAPLVIKVFLEASKIGKVDEALTYYVIHNESQTTIRDEKIFDILKITDIINQEMSKYEYMIDAKVNLIVMILLDYTIQQRYVKDKILRNKFIDEAFAYLNKLDKNWPKCQYLKRIPFIKRQVKANKFLTKIYCNYYSIKNN